MKRKFPFIGTHCRLIEEIPCAMGYLAVDDSRIAVEVEIIVNPYVHHPQGKTMLSAKHAYRSTSLGIVHHLLCRHLTRRTRHPFALYAMISSKKYVARMQQLGMGSLLNQSHLYRQRL